MWGSSGFVGPAEEEHAELTPALAGLAVAVRSAIDVAFLDLHGLVERARDELGHLLPALVVKLEQHPDHVDVLAVEAALHGCLARVREQVRQRSPRDLAA